MEWVETTGRTVEEAKDRALDQLGVDEVDAEFEIVEEPRPGLFGRVRGEARVRARVRPTRPRPKVERRERRRRGPESTASAPAEATNDDAEPAPDTADEQADEKDATRRRRSRRSAEPAREPAAVSATAATAAKGNGASPKAARGEDNDESVGGDGGEESGGPDAVAPLAASFLSGLAAAFGVESTTVTEIEGDELEVRLEGADLGLLIGPRGQTLLAIQDLARTVSQRGIPDHGRLRIDVGGYRERRRDALARFTTDVAQQVLEGGSPRMLEPMAAADRKVVHDTASTITGVQTRSEGEEPNRRVVILPGD